MKVWRVISLLLWSIVLTAMLLVSGTYYLLSSTVLDQAKATNALRQTGFYDTVREQLLVPKIQEQFSAGQDSGAILSSKDVVTEAEKVFTPDKMQHITDEVLNAVYQWSDNKAPNIDFTIPVTTEKEALAKALEVRIRQNVEKMPRCNSASEISDDLATATCLPYYINKDAAISAVIDDVHGHLQHVSDTLTPETLGLTNKDLKSAVNIPDYIGYLWTLNLITLPLALIITLYLLLKRHGAGLVSIGLSIFTVGLAAISAYVMLHGVAGESFAVALDREVVKASKLLLEPMLLLASGIGLAAGVAAVTGGIFWLRASRKS